MPNGAPEKKCHSILLESFFTKQFCSQCEGAQTTIPPFPSSSLQSMQKIHRFRGNFSALSLLCASGDPGAFTSCPCGQDALEMVLYEGVMWKDGAVTARLPLALSISWSHEKLLEPNAVCLVFGFPNSLRSVQTGPSEAVPLP